MMTVPRTKCKLLEESCLGPAKIQFAGKGRCSALGGSSGEASSVEVANELIGGILGGSAGPVARTVGYVCLPQASRASK